MSTGRVTVIGYLGGRESRAAHFNTLESFVPSGVRVETEPLSLWREANQHPEEAEQRYVSSVAGLIQGHTWDAVGLTGTPNEVLYPTALERIRAGVVLPVTASLAASIAALRALGVHSLLLLTPFDQAMNERVGQLIEAAGIEAVLPPTAFDDIDEAAALGSEGAYAMARAALEGAAHAEAICFQGARLDPLPVLERLEKDTGKPVIASNPAMLWQLLSILGQRHRIEHGGVLLREWPPYEAAAG